MPVRLFNPSEPADLLERGTGMVRAAASRLVGTGGAKQPYGVRPHRLPPPRLPHRSAAPQKPLRADPTVIQSPRLDPRRVTAPTGDGTGIDTRVRRVSSQDRIGSVSR